MVWARLARIATLPPVDGRSAERLLEREWEIAQLDRALDDALSGRGRVIAVQGPPGIGKTRLLGGVVDRCRSAEWAVATARSSELEREFAFGVVRQLFEEELTRRDKDSRDRLLSGAAAHAEHVFAAAPGLGGRGAGPGFASIHGLYWLTTNLAAEQPLLLALDDAQWIDAASLRWLHHLSTRLEGHPILVVLALRPGEPDTESESLAALVAEANVEVVEPQPLSEEAVAVVVDRHIGRLPATDVSLACHEATGGNPFLLDELLRSLPDEVELTAEAIRRAAPSSIARHVQARLERMDRHAPGLVELAQVASVLGDGAHLASTAAIASVSIEAAARTADRLVDVHVLAGSTPIEFVHPVVWSVIYHDIPEAQRALLHARAAEVLATLGAGPDQTAAHLLRAPPRGGDDVVETLSGAAASAIARGAPEVAVSYLRRALAEPPSADRRGGLLRELGTAEQLIQDPQSEAHLDEALTLENDPHGCATSARLLANMLILQIDIPGGMRALDRALDLVPAEDRELRLTLEADRFPGWIVPGLGDDLADRLHKAIGTPRRGAETVGERLCFAALAIVGLLRSETGAAVVDHADRALGEDALLTELTGESSTWIACVTALWAHDHLERAVSLFTAGIDDARARGSLFGYAHASAFRGLCAWRMGDLTGAEADSRTALDAPGTLPMEVASLAVAPMIWALTDRGQLDEADAELRERGLQDHAPPGHHATWLLEARGRLRLAQRDPQRARRDFEEIGRRYETMQMSNPGLMPWRSCLALALLALGEHEAAREPVRDELVLARQIGSPRAIGLALRADGLLQGGQAGIELLEDSAQSLRTSESPLDLARTLIDLGGALRRSGRRGDARAPLAEALELAHRSSAHHLASLAEAELRAAGARPRRRVQTGADALTPSEQRIASLAMTGLTNKEIAQSQFLTIKTVEMHLANTYRKLKIRSRRDLAAAMNQPMYPDGT